MSSPRSLAVNGISIVIIGLYIFAGQAHFTDRLTPDFAQYVDDMTHNSHAAFWFLGLDYLPLKRLFGAFDLLAAALLCRRATRKTGLTLAIIGFGGGIYGQLYTGGDLAQVSALFGLACLGRLLAAAGN